MAVGGVGYWPDDATVPSFGPRRRCSRCGKLGAMAVPNWIEGITGRRPADDVVAPHS
jgi:hypothetical protein